MSNLCPICNKDDSIQKVSVIVSAGKASGTFSGPSGGVAYIDGKWGTVGGYTTLSGSTMSELAKLLSPPPAPNSPKGYTCLEWIGLLFVAMILIPFVSGVLIIVSEASMTVLGVFPNDPDTTDVIGGFIFLIIAFVVIAFLVSLNQKRLAASEKRYAIEKHTWNLAMQRWNRLYFCQRDGIVFDPETGETCDPSNIQNFLYGKALQPTA